MRHGLINKGGTSCTTSKSFPFHGCEELISAHRCFFAFSYIIFTLDLLAQVLGCLRLMLRVKLSRAHCLACSPWRFAYADSNLLQVHLFSNVCFSVSV